MYNIHYYNPLWTSWQVAPPLRPSKMLTNSSETLMTQEIIALHGAPCRINEFSYDFTNQGNDQHGSGFYFTSVPEDAFGYCFSKLQPGLEKPGADGDPAIVVAKLRFDELLDSEACHPLTREQVLFIIKRSPTLDDCLMDWGDVPSEGRQSVLNRAADTYATDGSEEGGPLLLYLHKLANDFFPEDIRAFNLAVRDATGFDGVVAKAGHATHYVAWFPQQIEIIEHIGVAGVAPEVAIAKAAHALRPSAPPAPGGLKFTP